MRPADGTDPRCLGLEPLPAFTGELPDNLADIPADAESRLTCRWHLDQEGAFLFYSHGAPAGGEGDGGSLAQGLFGTVNVEPKGSPLVPWGGVPGHARRVRPRLAAQE